MFLCNSSTHRLNKIRFFRPRVPMLPQNSKILVETMQNPRPSQSQGDGKDAKSRFWATYTREAADYDGEFLEKYQSDMDIVLIFVGTFSLSSLHHLNLNHRLVCFQPSTRRLLSTCSQTSTLIHSTLQMRCLDCYSRLPIPPSSHSSINPIRRGRDLVPW